MMGVTDRKTSLLNQGSPSVGQHGFQAEVQLRVHEARHQEGLAGSQLWKLPDCYGKTLNITRSTGTRRRLSSFYKDKWWPSLFPEGEKVFESICSPEYVISPRHPLVLSTM